MSDKFYYKRRAVTCKVEYEFWPDSKHSDIAIVYAWFGEKLIRLGWVSRNGTSGPDGFPIPTDAIEFAREFLDSLLERVKPHDATMDPDMEITRVDVPRSNPSWPIPPETIPEPSNRRTV